MPQGERKPGTLDRPAPPASKCAGVAFRKAPAQASGQRLPTAAEVAWSNPASHHRPSVGPDRPRPPTLFGCTSDFERRYTPLPAEIDQALRDRVSALNAQYRIGSTASLLHLGAADRREYLRGREEALVAARAYREAHPDKAPALPPFVHRRRKLDRPRKQSVKKGTEGKARVGVTTAQLRKEQLRVTKRRILSGRQ